FSFQDFKSRFFMPLPVSTMILLAAASIALISHRTVQVRGNGYRAAYFLASLLISSYFLLTEQVQAVQNYDGTTTFSPWWNDALALSEQWLLVVFGLLAQIAVFDSARYGKETRSDCGIWLFALSGMMLVARSNDFLSLGLSVEIVHLALFTLRRRSHGLPPD